MISFRNRLVFFSAMKINIKIICICSLAVILDREPAYDYVDPGFLGAMYQLIYMFIFGVLATWVIKPFKLIGEFFRKIKAHFKINDSD